MVYVAGLIASCVGLGFMTFGDAAIGGYISTVAGFIASGLRWPTIRCAVIDFSGVRLKLAPETQIQVWKNLRNYSIRGIFTPVFNNTCPSLS